MGWLDNTSGTAGRIENYQIGVFLAYSTLHSHALIARKLYLPKEWAKEKDRRAEAHIPDKVSFATKPCLGQKKLTQALEAGVQAKWVCADSVYGCDYRFRQGIEDRDLEHVVEVRKDQRVWVGTRQRRVR